MFMISVTCDQKTPIRNISYLVGEKWREWSPSSVWDIASVLLVIILAESNLRSKLSSSDAWVGYMPPIGKSKMMGYTQNSGMWETPYDIASQKLEHNTVVYPLLSIKQMPAGCVYMIHKCLPCLELGPILNCKTLGLRCSGPGGACPIVYVSFTTVRSLGYPLGVSKEIFYE